MAQQPLAEPFRHKPVHELACRFCRTPVCGRAMKAVLLADVQTVLFSTDTLPKRCILVNAEVRTEACHCRIRDMACDGCGNVIGYHVTQPCSVCLQACNNGHLFMFHGHTTIGEERPNLRRPSKPLLWASLPPPAADQQGTHMDTPSCLYVDCCR
ncbi:uncharacterized protein MONBRDRAFT_8460 [Monosiga brevicollis MX1]|uniref:Protein FAM72 n=1 Tax=Monosiga brevicollis TaxID=81824 RepID=A9V038_MONBE|nr:uncharacterized protein MONBRDRAFT_8460 [Monosiga brevicollis MX1]EDQ88942.1 predicted protein [Monosiga brevicollis MX1]|eukprot:XP_001746047.1 hypothetical protein [Monosiga brevicollis MX1]